jgi:5-methylcytosine-specific restriction endonuclease McrA
MSSRGCRVRGTLVKLMCSGFAAPDRIRSSLCTADTVNRRRLLNALRLAGISLLIQGIPMSSKHIRQVRQQAFQRQNCCCYYCNFPIWEQDSKHFSLTYAIAPRFAKYLKSTAEHLIARQDDGLDTADNVVAACAWCNKMRHFRREFKATDPSTYRSQVWRLISMGRWHPLAASQSTRRPNVS